MSDWFGLLLGILTGLTIGFIVLVLIEDFLLSKELDRELNALTKDEVKK